MRKAEASLPEVKVTECMQHSHEHVHLSQPRWHSETCQAHKGTGSVPDFPGNGDRTPHSLCKKLHLHEACVLCQRSGTRGFGVNSLNGARQICSQTQTCAVGQAKCHLCCGPCSMQAASRQRASACNMSSLTAALEMAGSMQPEQFSSREHMDQRR